MNFFDYQDRARVWTRWLVGLYLLAVIGIVLAVYGATLATVAHYGPAVHRFRPSVRYHADSGTWDGASSTADSASLWHPELFLWCAGITLVILLSGSAYKMAALAGGGGVVARLMGGTPLPPGGGDAAEQRLRNVVEEMAIASGTPVPEIFVLQEESSINAFASGHTTHDAAIAVTRGAMENLSRDELQGVIAHEFSHILNGDMRMNVRLMGLLHGILMIALAGYYLMRVTASSGSSDRRGKGGNPLPLLGLAIMVIGYIGVFFANLIKAAIGREREYLADASAAQFTRNPLGLAHALTKIGALAQTGGRIAAPEAAQTSHFFIADPGVHTWLSFMDTHPPLLARINRLDPTFTGDFAEARHDLRSAAVPPPLPDAPATSQPAAPASARAQVSGLADRVGATDFQSVAYAATLLDAIPQPCRQAAAHADDAQGVIFALLLSSRPDIRQRQMALLARQAPANVYAKMSFLESQCAAVPAASRLPLADLAVSALRYLEPDEYRAFRDTLLALVAADGEVDLQEFTLLHMVGRRLDRAFGLAAAPRVRFTTLAAVRDDVSALLATLAWRGTNDDTAAATAFQCGWNVLDGGDAPTDAAACPLTELDDHLNRLAEAAPQLKARILAACGACVAADGHTTLAEAETLRAIADALDCPVPPFAPDIVE